MNNRSVIVISDLHLGGDKDLDDFCDEIEEHFCDFLVMLSNKYEPCELVINGDFLDFVQAAPWKMTDVRSFIKQDKGKILLCFTEEQSLQKLSELLPIVKTKNLLVNGG